MSDDEEEEEEEDDEDWTGIDIDGIEFAVDGDTGKVHFKTEKDSISVGTMDQDFKKIIYDPRGELQVELYKRYKGTRFQHPDLPGDAYEHSYYKFPDIMDPEFDDLLKIIVGGVPYQIRCDGSVYGAKVTKETVVLSDGEVEMIKMENLSVSLVYENKYMLFVNAKPKNAKEFGRKHLARRAHYNASSSDSADEDD